MVGDERLTIVVLTHERHEELAHCLRQLAKLPGPPPIIVVDNGSRTPTRAVVKEHFANVRWLRCERNIGAAGRNVGVSAVQTPYVAFCDDDTWWAAGALERASALLDANPRVAAISARVLVGPECRRDPTCDRMAASPLPRDGLPGQRLIGFMAGAVVMRVAAYRQVGGYEPRLFLGAEEALMSLDLASQGWDLVYADDICLHHHPSAARDAGARTFLLLRNRLWIAWLRLPVALAWRQTRGVLQQALLQRMAMRVMLSALRDGFWVLRQRRTVPAAVAGMVATTMLPQRAAPNQASGYAPTGRL